MIFLEKSVFLELAKTGSTYARYILIALDKTKYTTIGKKHNIYNSLSKDEKKLFDSKLVVASVRNPFDWYVSLYAFGCEHRGGLYTWTQKRPDILSVKNGVEFFKVLANFVKFHSEWKEVFSDVNNIQNFSKFLNLIYSSSPLGCGFRYQLGGFHKFMGFYSYDYFRMTTRDFDENSSAIKSYEDLVDYYERNNLTDLVLRNENLKNDLLLNADKICTGRDELQRAIDSKPKNSKTKTKRMGYKEYYTPELIELVAQKERFIIAKYGYSFE